MSHFAILFSGWTLLAQKRIPLRFAPFDRASFAFALLRSGQASPFDKGGLRGIFPKGRRPGGERAAGRGEGGVPGSAPLRGGDTLASYSTVVMTKFCVASCHSRWTASPGAGKSSATHSPASPRTKADPASRTKRRAQGRHPHRGPAELRPVGQGHDFVVARPEPIPVEAQAKAGRRVLTHRCRVGPRRAVGDRVGGARQSRY